MTIASNIDKTRKDIEKVLNDKLGDKSPVHLVAGVSDRAVERVRAAGSGIASRAESFDAKALRDQAQARFAALPGIAQELPGKAQEVAEDAVTVVFTSALTAYGDLSGRSKTLIDRVRGQQSTAEPKDDESATVAKAKAATTPRKATSKKAAKKATPKKATAKKSATATKKAAKSATTSAQTTATDATKVSDDAASTAGDHTTSTLGD